MVEIVPAILTESPEELVRMVHILERMGVTRAHLDICDGIFVPSRSIDGYNELRRLACKMRWDVHLMVQDPEHYMDQWHPVTCVDRMIVHVESIGNMNAIAEGCHAHNHQLWHAINPETSIEKLEDTTPDGVMFMTVHPGAQGRAFVPEVLPRIREYHAKHPAVPLMVDGGVSTHTAHHCVAAGATHLVTGSAIFRSPDPARALRDLLQSVAE